MENPIYIALSRQTALRRQMSVVANNIANMNTASFKKEVMLFQAYTQKVPFTQKMDYVIDQGTATDLSQGELTQTHNAFDMAISGPGYFSVDDGTGTKYTRNGTFTLDERNRLVTQQGYPVLDTQGNPIVVPVDDTDITVSEDGVIRRGNTTVATLGIVEVANPLGLRKIRDSLFDTKETPTPATGSKVVQGMVESSNVNPVGEMTNMLEVQRSYEAVKNMIDSEDKRQQAIIQRLARPMQVA